jgi:undecaprenyl diphosphate synthase
MHVAIIMDGNGRWAQRRGLKRSVGHRAGARAVRRVVESAAKLGVDVLTLYAFSADNWSRPADEVGSLMRLLQHHLRSEIARCVENGIRINVIGRRDRLASNLIASIEHAEHVTRFGRRMTLQLAIDYSARDAIARAASRIRSDDATIRRFAHEIANATHSTLQESSVDLLIRTGGEKRLSDFLLFECAYAELVFIDACWPDFDESAFARALEAFRQRERRFGGLPGKEVGALADAAG